MDTIREFDLYNDIRERTGGEIYLGIVGPVRTGKSTFIKKFMEQMILPLMEEDYAKMIAQDEMPQSAAGKTITTTEPKFIPKEAATVTLGENTNVKIRLIDCVGYMVDGAAGHIEDDAERMVKTPWFDVEIPFTKAAEVGTRKVITDHSTIGVVVTTDGSFGELGRNQYLDAEAKCVQELKAIGKPFVILLNTQKPYSDETTELSHHIATQYGCACIPVNCEQLKKNDILKIMEEILYEFPISAVEFYMPKWVEMMPVTHKMKKDIVEKIMGAANSGNKIQDMLATTSEIDCEYIKKNELMNVDLASGKIKYRLQVDDTYYYEMISELAGETITSEFQMLELFKKLATDRKEYEKAHHAMEAVRYKGYGVIMPEKEEIKLNTPEVIKHGNKYGVKINAECPSIHMIRASIETEIAPIVGSKEQAEDLITYIEQEKTSENGMWQTNIFGKTVEQLVNDGITSKINMLNDECQMKLQDSMQKIVNDNTGGMICIII